MRTVAVAALLIALAHTRASAQMQTYDQRTEKLRGLVEAIDAGSNDVSMTPLSGWLIQAASELKALKPGLTPAEKTRASFDAYATAVAKYQEFQDDVYRFLGNPPPEATRQADADRITTIQEAAHKAVLLADSLFNAGN